MLRVTASAAPRSRWLCGSGRFSVDAAAGWQSARARAITTGIATQRGILALVKTPEFAPDIAPTNTPPNAGFRAPGRPADADRRGQASADQGVLDNIDIPRGKAGFTVRQIELPQTQEACVEALR